MRYAALLFIMIALEFWASQTKACANIGDWLFRHANLLPYVFLGIGCVLLLLDCIMRRREKTDAE